MLDDLIPQRYEETAVDDRSAFINNDDWVLEQKLDGCRALAVCRLGEAPVPITRGGKVMTFGAGLVRWRNVVPALVAADLNGVALDGELLGEDRTFWLFDCPVAGNGTDLRGQKFEVRRAFLEMLYGEMVSRGVPGWGSAIRLVGQARTTDEKAALWDQIVETGVEGAVAKRRSGLWVNHARRLSKDVRKLKITSTVDCVVTGRNMKSDSSAELSVWSGGRLQMIGACSMIGKPDAQIGDVVEVKYLYAINPEAPKLYQPTLLQIRTDKAAEDCTLDQLVYASKAVV